MSKELPACPVEITLQLISSKWTVLIIRDLTTGTKRFGELKKSLKKALFEINQKMRESHMQDMILSENIYMYDSEEGNLQAV